MERGRVEAFSDGVMAVAITLLAVNLTVAGPGHGPLLQQLADHRLAFVAYGVSFLVIGIIWINHHAVMSNVASVDRALLATNLLLMLFVVLLPFATATMAEYLASNDQDAHISMALYAGVLEGTGVAFTALFALTMRPGTSVHRFPEGVRRTAFMRFGVGVLVYLVAIVVAFFSPPLSLTIIGLAAAYYLVARSTIPHPPG